MQQNFRLALKLSIFVLILACAKAFNDHMSVRIPWQSKNGSYVNQYVPVGITEIKDISGPDAVFFMEPTLFLDMERNHAEVTGPAPRSKFVKIAEGLFVPASFNTLNLTTVYAHLERLNQELRNLGYSDLLTFPMRVGVNPKAKFGNNSMQNNAAYVSTFDSIFLFPFDEVGLPLSMNGGVLAHEYFHAIFHHAYQFNVFKYSPNLGSAPLQELRFCTDEVTSDAITAHVEVARPDKACAKETLNEDDQFAFVMKAINEGLADVWAWIYTDDTDFMRHSFGNKQQRRKLDGNFLPLQSPANVQEAYVHYMRATGCNAGMSHNLLRSQAYGQGTNLGRFIVEHAKQNNINRYQVAKRILETLNRLPIPRSEKNKNITSLTFNHFIEAYFEGATPPSHDECNLIAKISNDMSGIKACAKQ